MPRSPRVNICAILATASLTGISFAAFKPDIPPLKVGKYLEMQDSRSRGAMDTLLFSHCQQGNLQALKKAGSLSADIVNQLHPVGGWSLLHTASINGHAHIVSHLLQAGADPNLKELPCPSLTSRQALLKYHQCRQMHYSEYMIPTAHTAGFTPLHCAVVDGNEEVVRLLLQAGADPSIRDDDGHLPIDFFDPSSQSTRIVDMLRDAELDMVEKRKQAEKEMRKKHPLEKHLRNHIVGQDAPIDSLGSAIRRKQNGWHDEGRPLVFLFLGSSGIGKTELAKQLASYLHPDSSEAFIRIDMSEFQSKHEVAKFIGSPPGYVGYDEGGQLTSKLKATPNAVVLLDEVEKAHIDVLTVMLQVFDEGRLTDGKGQTIDCKDAIFVMTSNLVQQEIASEADILRSASDKAVSTSEESPAKQFIDNTVYPILRAHFQRDEFLGRINEILFFLPFTQSELELIVEKELMKWKQRALSKHEIEMTWDKSAVNALSHGYNIHYGARSIKYEVEKRVVNQIAKAHEMDDLAAGSTIHFSADDKGHLRMDMKKGAPKSSAASKLKFW
eukprot:Partr_v1_DN27995_c2_g1_i2_m11291 putative ClpB caseinolytic peptidase B homolog (E. coli)